MEAAERQSGGNEHDVQAGTLGEVLYPDRSKKLVPESEWVALVQSIAAGEQPALHALYDRSHRIVFTLMVRITSNRETAEELTLDVFHDVWRRASQYDPANGTVLGWIMNQARSRAIDRVRFDSRKKRVNGDGTHLADEVAESHDVVEFRQRADALRRALASLKAEERQVIEASFFSGQTYAEAAAQLKLPLGTVKSRIHEARKQFRETLGESYT